MSLIGIEEGILIKYSFTVLILNSFPQISPLRIEEIIKQHPGVAEACVVGINNVETMELAVAAIMPRPNTTIVAQEVFDLIDGKFNHIF